MIIPSYEKVKQYQNDASYNYIPVACEILSDFLTPITALRILKNVSDHVFMLESVEGRDKWGRYTFIGFNPKMEITCLNGEFKAGGINIKTDRPDDYIRQLLNEYKMPKMSGMPRPQAYIKTLLNSDFSHRLLFLEFSFFEDMQDVLIDC